MDRSDLVKVAFVAGDHQADVEMAAIAPRRAQEVE